MKKLTALYQSHIEILQQYTRDALERNHLDGLLIHSGEPVMAFLDDHAYPFKVNPHFKYWVPVTDVPHCWLWVDGVNKPKLWFYSPVDYWYAVEPIPNSYWTDDIEIIPIKNVDEINDILPIELTHVAYIGSSKDRALQIGVAEKNINPQPVLDFFHYYRAYKSEYELYCMREAQKIAVIGHQAARQAFYSEMNEFDINIAYLNATGHRDTDVPYQNIVALNEHAATLHYTKLNPQLPDTLRSFLIDAGAEYHGYAADITRTYAKDNNGLFNQLIQALNMEQQALIASIKTGVRYTDYHIQMHQRLASLLLKHEIVQDINVEEMVEIGITSPFLPHGLGHPLGLQVHDVGGFMQDDCGTHLAAPAQYPYLRCTRIIESNMVMTIEPGLYFIDTLLAPWREGQFSQYFNWSLIDLLKPYGGIRIEDNIVIHDDRVENMTRNLKLT